jgi:hypothetical protein
MDTTQKAQCTVVNAFLRDIDVFLATRAQAIIPCKELRARIYKSGIKYRHKATQKLVLKAALMIWKRVMCKNDVTVNIAEIRRDISRLQCFVDDDEQVRVKIHSIQKDAPPLPTGFVRPREYPQNWSPEWAQSHGWIQDPYYDWLEPAAVKQHPKRQEQIEFFPKPFSSMTSSIISCICMIAIGVGIWYFFFKKTKQQQTKSPSQTDIDEEFMNAPPPTTNLEFTSSATNDMPSTTDLMKEFQSVQRSQSTLKSSL